ncbi:MAG TPA: DinB family protein [Streptosporangiaceae bacterium]|jgi:uncharacterized damage-inducible protein DinB
MPSDEQHQHDDGVEIVRNFGWDDMFVPPDEDPRSFAPVTGERATLTDYLGAYRQTLELKCRGLDAEGMARRSCPPSDLSLLGLVRHLADAELHWFRRVLTGQDVPSIFRAADGQAGQVAFEGALPDPAVVAHAWAAWRGEVAFAERFVAEAPDLDVAGRLKPDGDEEISLREVLVHMIEEYARHCGHADLLRERVDGRVGQ